MSSDRGATEPRILDPEPIAAHVRYLQAFGYSYQQIARAAGVNEGTPLRAVRGRLKFVQARIGNAILAVEPAIEDLAPHTIIPSRGIRRRIEALATRGWSIAAIADRAHLSRTRVSHLMWNDGATVRNHLLIAAIYAGIWDEEPPAETVWDRRTVLRTRNRAAALGWAPPLAWDDIDNDPAPQRPADSPDTIDLVAIDLVVKDGARVSLTRAERHIAVRQLHARPLSDGEIAQLLNVNVRTIQRDRLFLGLPAAVGADGLPLPIVDAA
ncbi:hypothetical protein [Microbacterium sp.]|uniref:hypothetical protein n=1 Tax=Microbacterium sp. TaxID=51671 RepID=UPI0037C7473A